jgi:hypothetical protein
MCKRLVTFLSAWIFDFSPIDFRLMDFQTYDSRSHQNLSEDHLFH